MANITVKNSPADLYGRLMESAATHHRSIGGEIIACMESSLGSQKADPDAFLVRARQLSGLWKGEPLTDSQVIESKNAGHP